MTEKKSSKGHRNSSVKPEKKASLSKAAVQTKGKNKPVNKSKEEKTGRLQERTAQTEPSDINEQQEDIAILRERLLQADRELLEALNKKVALEKKCFSQQASAVPYGAGAEKNLPGSPVMGSRYTDWNLDHQRIETMALANRNKPDGASETCVRTVFREILGEVRRHHHLTRVAFLGPAYSYTHLAAMRYFGNSAELVPVSSIAGIFEEVDSNQCSFGVVPIENSTDGRIVDTLEMFTKTKAKISGEVIMPIRHCLVGNAARNQIKKIFSKPQAISQCRNWLSTHLSWAELCESSSTTQALEWALANPGKGYAAIASAEAAKANEADIIAENIEDNPDNKTRFVVLGKNYYPRKGKDKTAVLFQLRHVVGALAEALNIFKRNHLNLTWIESFPVRGQDNEYLFFAEMEGHVRDLKIRRVIDALCKRTIKCEVLGSFPADDKNASPLEQ